MASRMEDRDETRIQNRHTNKIIWSVRLSRSAIPLAEIVQCGITIKNQPQQRTNDTDE